MKTIYDCCSWVLVNATKETPGKTCRAPTKWHMVRDDAGNLVRKYEAFCVKHAAAAEAQRREEGW